MNIGRSKSILFLISIVVISTFLISYTINSLSNIEIAVNDNTSDNSAVLGEVSEETVVTRVVDGDTIEIATGEKVRYIGIDTPEDPLSENSECFALNSYLKNKELVLGESVRMERDVSETDRYGRLLRYIYVGDTFVNLEMVKEGYAVAKEYPPDTKYSDILEAAELRARENKLGIWRNCAQGEYKVNLYLLNEIIDEFFKSTE